jgi:hypothetical protein
VQKRDLQSANMSLELIRHFPQPFQYTSCPLSQPQERVLLGRRFSAGCTPFPFDLGRAIDRGFARVAQEAARGWRLLVAYVLAQELVFASQVDDLAVGANVSTWGDVPRYLWDS